MFFIKQHQSVSRLFLYNYLSFFTASFVSDSLKVLPKKHQNLRSPHAAVPSTCVLRKSRRSKRFFSSFAKKQPCTPAGLSQSRFGFFSFSSRFLIFQTGFLFHRCSVPSIQLCARRDVVINHEQVKFFAFAVLEVVYCGKQHAAGLNAHHCSGRKVCDGN